MGMTLFMANLHLNRHLSPNLLETGIITYRVHFHLHSNIGLVK